MEAAAKPAFSARSQPSRSHTIMADDKAMKVAFKEGGKKGVDLQVSSRSPAAAAADGAAVAQGPPDMLPLLPTALDLP